MGIKKLLEDIPREHKEDPEDEKTKQVTFRLTAGEIRKLKEMAKIDGGYFSGYIRKILRRHIREHDEK